MRTVLPLAVLCAVGCATGCAAGATPDVPVDPADVIPWERLDVAVREGRSRTWLLAFHNPLDQAVDLAPPDAEGCGACVHATWEHATLEGGALRLPPRGRGLLRITYGGSRLTTERYLLVVRWADGSAEVRVPLGVHRTWRPLRLRPITPFAVVGRSDAVEFAVEGDGPGGPLYAAGGPAGPPPDAGRVLLAPAGWWGRDALLRLAPLRAWRPSNSRALTLDSADGAERNVLLATIAGRDPFRALRSSRAAVRSPGIVANLACGVEVGRGWESDGAPVAVFHLAPHERLLLPGRRDTAVRLRDLDGEFELTLGDGS